jgi:hypothetical protein
MWFKNFFGGSTSRQSRKSLRRASTVSLSLESLEQRETPSGGLTMRLNPDATPAASMVGITHVAPPTQVIYYASAQP